MTNVLRFRRFWDAAGSHKHPPLNPEPKNVVQGKLLYWKLNVFEALESLESLEPLEALESLGSLASLEALEALESL